MLKNGKLIKMNNKNETDSNKQANILGGKDMGVLKSCDIVYMVDNSNKVLFVFKNDCPKYVLNNLKLNKNSSVHIEPHKKAFTGQEVSYQWWVEIDSEVIYYQTNLTPVHNSKGKVVNILGVVKNISTLTTPTEKINNIIADKSNRSIGQTILHAREDEKKKISTTIHDELGSMAITLSSKIAILEDDIKEKQIKSALIRLNNLQTQLIKYIDRLKDVIVTLRPPNLDDVGLKAALKDLVGTLAENTNMKVKLSCPDEICKHMDGQVRIVIYRVVQESLTNVVKHSKAKNVIIKCSRTNGNVKLEISDDGVGFKPKKASSIRNIGIIGMKEQVNYIGGEFKINSIVGKGTKVLVRCPATVYMVEL